MITDDSLKQIMPNLPEAKRAALLRPLQSAMNEFEVNTPKREAAFLAQIAHESMGLTRFVENLNYGAQGLMETWPKRFPDPAIAQRIERNPEKIANYVYANIIGNGDEASGDGWRFRGRGPIQITGKENYAKYGGLINVDLVNNPEQAAAPEAGFRIAGAYWRENGLNIAADAEQFKTITKRINPALKGLDDRLKYYALAKAALGVPVARGLMEPESEEDILLPPEFTRGSEALDAGPPAEKQRKPRKRKTKPTPVKSTKKKADKKKASKKNSVIRTNVSRTRQPGKRKPKAAKRRT
jgi:putative chitinase